MLREYGIDFSKNINYLKDNTLALVKLINQHSTAQSLSELPFASFQAFLLQYAYFVYVYPSTVPADVTAFDLLTRLFQVMKQKKNGKDIIFKGSEKDEYV